jgi:hypothetical protein
MSTGELRHCVTQGDDFPGTGEQFSESHLAEGLFRGSNHTVEFLMQGTERGVPREPERAFANPFQWSDRIHNVQQRDFLRLPTQGVASARPRTGCHQARSGQLLHHFVQVTSGDPGFLCQGASWQSSGLCGCEGSHSTHGVFSSLGQHGFLDQEILRTP